ncbi:sensor histidine kinase [Spongiivirga citrea]|uniref:histidine kinase n=1 Tax=Spongiivirga citrea TaxID=1481457 RepID=A0A6M0CDI1_9FLAO|nr:histidine kinase [Spongiivirga citrea]NER15856.1 hypothetical protein [Spongiivirga citrea]
MKKPYFASVNFQRLLTYFYKKCFLSVACCLFGGLCYAQTNIKHYTSSDGLAHDVTYNIIQDSKGYIWICTDDGLSKFDGKKFTNYGLKNGLTSNYIMDVKELDSTTLVISTWGGGLHFLKNDTIFKSSKFHDNNTKILDIDLSDDMIYVQSGSRFFFYSLKDSTLSKQSFIDGDRFSDAYKNVISFNHVGLSHLDDKLVIHDQGSSSNNISGIRLLKNTKETAPYFEFLDTLEISAATKNRNNQYVFGTTNQLIFTSSSSITNTHLVSSIPANEKIVKIRCSPKELNTYFIIARDSYGFKTLYSYNTLTKESNNLLEEFNINTTISDAIFDFEGNLWITTFGNGVYCYYHSNPTIKNKIEGNYVVDLTYFRNNIYALTPSKLFKFLDEEIVATYPLNGFAKKLTVVDDSLFVSALNASSEKSISGFNFINGRFIDKSSHGIIVQTDTIKVDGKTIYDGDEIVVNAIEDEQDKITFYTNKGRWSYTPKNDLFEPDSIFNQTVYGDRIQGHKKQKDSYYIYTDKGLFLVKKDSIKVYDEKKGIQNERINDLFVDETLYLATQGGLSIIENDNILNFSKSIGFNSLAINKILPVNNSLWLAGDNGISIIERKSLKETPPPRMNITQDNTLFKYEVISFEDVGIKVAYRLNNNDWVSLNPTENNIDFSSYAKDDYEVIFKSRKDHSNWVYSDTFKFAIRPPWYQRWWVLAIGAFSIVAVIGLSFYYRLRAISKRNIILQNAISKRIVAEKELGEVRDTIARDFHDDLGNKLASISLLSDLLSKRVSTSNTNLIKSIKEDADHLYKGTKDFIFSLQEKSNYLDEVSFYLSDFAEDYLYQFGISFELESDIKKGIKLPYYWSKQIIFIFKEAITNTVKHSHAKNAYMSFHFQNRTLTIELKDDGVGFDLDEVSMNGLTNMKTRADKINCELVLQTKNDQGTCIIFKGKLPQKGRAD